MKYVKLTCLLLITSPFYHYYEIFDFRLILVSPFLLIILVFLNRGVFKKNNLLYVLFVLFLFFVMYAFSSKNNDTTTLFAFVVFNSFLIWPFFVVSHLSNISLNQLIKTYGLFAIFMALALIIQVCLFKYFGISLGRIELFKDRIAFSLFWQDFSFLSLYYCSAIPLLFYFRSNIKYIGVGTLVFAAIATSARTGIYSLLICFCAVLLFQFVSVARSKKVSLKDLFFLLSFVFLGIFIFIFNKYFMIIEKLSSRKLTLNDSGRFDGFWDSLEVFLAHPVAGYQFDIIEYTNVIGIIPHNIFLYSLSLGGLLYFIVFLLFLILLAIEVLKTCDSRLILSVMTCFLGLQFIPSIFSAYFVAILLSFCLFSNLKANK